MVLALAVSAFRFCMEHHQVGVGGAVFS